MTASGPCAPAKYPVERTSPTPPPQMRAQLTLCPLIATSFSGPTVSPFRPWQAGLVRRRGTAWHPVGRRSAHRADRLFVDQRHDAPLHDNELVRGQHTDRTGPRDVDRDLVLAAAPTGLQYM